MYGQKPIHAYWVGELVKVQAYAQWHALLESLPIVQAEGKMRTKWHKIKKLQQLLRKSENFMHFVFIL